MEIILTGLPAARQSSLCTAEALRRKRKRSRRRKKEDKEVGMATGVDRGCPSLPCEPRVPE